MHKRLKIKARENSLLSLHNVQKCCMSLIFIVNNILSSEQRTIVSYCSQAIFWMFTNVSIFLWILPLLFNPLLPLVLQEHCLRAGVVFACTVPSTMGIWFMTELPQPQNNANTHGPWQPQFYCTGFPMSLIHICETKGQR